jgi:formylmethanofuran dehydrogenase subunit C
MKLPKGYLRALLSLVLVMTITTLFTLRSYAAIETPAQDCTGTLTVKSGTVTVNGNASQTGATIMTGSVVATSGNGNAVIDLGAAGRVEVKGSTTVTITCVGGAIQIRTNCSKTEIEVKSGQVNVTTPSTETVDAGKSKDFGGPVEGTLSAGASIEVECEGRKAGGALLVGPGLIGLLALLGVGAAVAVGVAVGEGDTGGSGVEPVSPIR